MNYKGSSEPIAPPKITLSIQDIIDTISGVNYKDSYELTKTALMKAATKGHAKCVELLLEAGADVNMKDKNGDTALIEASNKGHDKCVKLLTEAGADVNIQNNNGFTSVMEASLMGHYKCVELLLEWGADVNMRSTGGDTALVWAGRNGHDKCLELLIEAGADVNMQNEWGTTALMKAAYRGHDKSVKLLLEAGANVNIQDKDMNTSLAHAAHEHHIACVKILLGQEAAVGSYQVPNWIIPSVKNNKKLKRLMMLLFSAGLDLLGLDEEHTKEAIREPERSLKNICREAIRNHLLQMSKVNLFVRVPRLGLPAILTDYLLYDQTLDDDDDHGDDRSTDLDDFDDEHLLGSSFIF